MSEGAQGAGAKRAAEETYRVRNRTHQEIRQRGAIASLNEGIEIETHGIRTRLIAWSGTGFQTESVHVLTHRPGDQSTVYRYDMADEAMICLKGKGEVFLWEAVFSPEVIGLFVVVLLLAAAFITILVMVFRKRHCPSLLCF